MNSALRTALLLGAVFILLVVFGVWYFFFAPAKTDAAEFVPSDAAVFATIPNGAHIALGYETSHLKQVVDAPEAQPILGYLRQLAGPKNIDLIQTLLPELTGQSFFALMPPAAPGGNLPVIAGFHPKGGAGDLDAFVTKIKSIYPGLAAQTSAGQVEGLDYQWVQATTGDKICMARYDGWLVAASNEATLQDWWERVQKKATSPSLAQNSSYQESKKRIGLDAEVSFYLDPHAFPGIFPGAPGAFSAGGHFEGGEIVDRYSFLLPRPAQADLGLVPTPCAFETLKFTSSDTRFYWGANFNWTQVWKNLQGLPERTPPGNATLTTLVGNLQNWAAAHHLDVQHDLIDPLDGEISLQAEWSADNSYPDAGLFLKLKSPDAFKPAEAAIVDTVRQAYEARAVVNEITSGGLNFATLKFVEPVPISPTITENGPYLGIFLSETHAVRSFQRDESIGLLRSGDFLRQLGDRRAGASQIAFFDSPRFSDRTYQTALPYLSLVAMFNRDLGALLQNRNPPPDLHWLAPIGTWTASLSADDEGLTGYSVSGIGNQGILLAAGTREAFTAFPALGNFLTGLIQPPSPPPVPPATPATETTTPPAPGIPPATPSPATTNAAPDSAAAPSPSTTNATPSAPAPAKSE